ncbi:RecQ type DNA helicase, N-terminal truncated compared to other tlh genes, partial [Schizosaccharomyces pombe]
MVVASEIAKVASKTARDIAGCFTCQCGTQFDNVERIVQHFKECRYRDETCKDDDIVVYEPSSFVQDEKKDKPIIVEAASEATSEEACNSSKERQLPALSALSALSTLTTSANDDLWTARLIWQSTNDTKLDNSPSSNYTDLNHKLANYGLSILSIHALMCVECECLLNVIHTAQHMQIVHKLELNEDLLWFQELRTLKLKSPTNVLQTHSSQTHVYPYIRGLPVLLNGYECVPCTKNGTGFVHAIMDTFRHHVRRTHGKVIKLENCIRRTALQTVKNKYAQRCQFFKVDYVPLNGGEEEEEEEGEEKEDAQNIKERMVDFCFSKFMEKNQQRREQQDKGENKKRQDDVDQATDNNTNTILEDDEKDNDEEEEEEIVNAREKNLLNQQFNWTAIVKKLGENWDQLVRFEYTNGIVTLDTIVNQLIRYYYRGFRHLSGMTMGMRRMFTQGGSYSAQERGLCRLEQKDTVVRYAQSAALYLIFLLRRPSADSGIRRHLEAMCGATVERKEGGSNSSSNISNVANFDSAEDDNDNDNDNDRDSNNNNNNNNTNTDDDDKLAYLELHEALKLAFLQQYDFSKNVQDLEIMEFLACMSLHKDGTSKYAYEISACFAPLIYTCRLVAACELQRLIDEKQIDLLSIPSFQTAGSIAYAHVFCFITLGQRNLYDVLYETQKVVRDIIRTEGYANTLQGLSPSTVLFQPRSNSMYPCIGDAFNNMVRLDLSELTALYEGMFAKVQDLLKELCFDMNVEKLLPISLLRSIGDDINNSKLGYSFFKESIEIRSSHSVLLRTILKNSELCHRFFPSMSKKDLTKLFGGVSDQQRNECDNYSNHYNDNSNDNDNDVFLKLHWSKSAIKKYETKASIFNELLFCLVYISAGQPARAQEMVYWTLRNGKYKTRELYLMFGRLMIYSRYDKTRNMKFAEKPIPRFLSEPLSILALRYYVLVRPLEALMKYVTTADRSKVAVYLDFMFVIAGERLQRDLPYRIFPKATYQCIQKPLGFRNYRHIAHYFKEKNIEEEMTRESYFDLQAGHTRNTALYIYGRTMDNLHYLPSDYFANFFRASYKWQELLQIRDNPTHGLLVETKHPFIKRVDQLEEALNEKLARLVGEQMVEGDKEKDKTNEEKNKDEVKAEMTQPVVNQDSHDLQDQLATTPTAPTAFHYRPGLLQPSQTSVQHCCWALSQYYGLEAKFRSLKQFQSVYFSLLNRMNLITVLPTGGGKSLSFLIPALIEKKRQTPGKVMNMVTLVLVPMMSLRQDMMLRVNEKGLLVCSGNWTAFKDVRLTLETQLPDLFILTYESALTNSGLRFFESLATLGRLARVVIDEAHLLLTSGAWRTALSRASRLSGLYAPLHLLSATFPRQLEMVARQTFCTNFYVLRETSTARENIFYFLHPYDNTEFLLDLRTLMKRTKVFEGDGRAIIFCRTKKDVEYIHRRLHQSDLFAHTHVTIYTGDVSDEERQMNFDAFRNANGKTRIMIATKAFGLGINYMGVRLVVHYGLPASSMDYVQETGRAGRDGKYAIAALFYEKYDSTWSSYVEDSMKNFLNDNTMCVRSFLASEMDGECVCCASFANCVYCSRCSDSLLGEESTVSTMYGVKPTLPETPKPAIATHSRYNASFSSSPPPQPGNSSGMSAMNTNTTSTTPVSLSELSEITLFPSSVSPTWKKSFGNANTNLKYGLEDMSLSHRRGHKRTYDEHLNNVQQGVNHDMNRVHGSVGGMSGIVGIGIGIGDGDGDGDVDSRTIHFAEYKSRVQAVKKQWVDSTDISAQLERFFRVYKDECLSCTLGNPDTEIRAHTGKACPVRLSTCYKCGKADHNLRECKLRIRFQGLCLFCGLTKFEHADSDMAYTSDCRSWARKANLISLVYYAWNNVQYRRTIADKFLQGDVRD